MRSDLEKYIGYYLLVYLVILSLYGFIEYIAVCNGNSLSCKFSLVKIKDALTIIASILTPIIALIIFLSWKSQFNKNLDKEYLTDFLEALRGFHNVINPIMEEIIKKTPTKLEFFIQENPEFYYLDNCNIEEIILKINIIDTITIELFLENIGINPYLLDICYRAKWLIKHLEKIKNEPNLEKKFNLLTKDFKIGYISRYERGIVFVPIVENCPSSMRRLQNDYLNLVSTIKHLRKA